MLALIARHFLYSGWRKRYVWGHDLKRFAFSLRQENASSLCFSAMSSGKCDSPLAEIALRGSVVAMSFMLLSGCGSFDKIFGTDDPLVSQRAAKQTMQSTTASSSFTALASNNSGFPRGLLIETPNGPVPAAFTSRSLGVKPSLCASLNNYWCIKTPNDGQRWEGQIGQDRSGHAYFSDPVYSARAFARIIRSYYLRRGVKSVSGIINRYAPTNDCIGSLRYCPINGVTISQHRSIDHTEQLGKKYIFYTSKKPNKNLFKRGQNCQKILLYCPRGRNKTEDYSADVAQMLQVTPTSNLNLFDHMGRIHYSRMVALMKAIAKWELGSQYDVDEALIREGMIMEVSDFRDSTPQIWPGILPQAFN